LGLIGWNGSPRVPFVANEKGSMVVVVVRDANVFEVGVVVVVDSSSELISKGMVGGGGGRSTYVDHCIVCRQIWKSLCKHIEVVVNPTIS
jgi:hypothetical protein